MSDIESTENERLQLVGSSQEAEVVPVAGQVFVETQTEGFDVTDEDNATSDDRGDDGFEAFEIAEQDSDGSSTTNTSRGNTSDESTDNGIVEDGRGNTTVMAGETTAALWNIETGYESEDVHAFDVGGTESNSDAASYGSYGGYETGDECSVLGVNSKDGSDISEQSSEEDSNSDLDDEPVDDSSDFTLLDGLQIADIKAQAQEEECEKRIREVLSLEEALRQIQIELEDAKAAASASKSLNRRTDRAMLIQIDSVGLSRELFAEYKMFCDFLQPDYGLQDGFSITCNENHNGSYVLYDPEFALFKEHVEFDYTLCNWRCEASVEKPYRTGTTEYVVEFWPLPSPEKLDGENQTWGRLFPKLYRMLKDASYVGSPAAKQILRRIPDRKATFTGWLFDYKFEELLADKPVVSHRWTLRGSHSLVDLDGDGQTQLLESLVSS